MSGPSVSILLPRPISPYEAQLIEQTIVAVCGDLAPWDEMDVVNTVTIGDTS